MGLETGTYISDLVPSNPPGTDKKKQGDDHLRLIKEVLQNTFPNANRVFNFPDSAALSMDTVLDESHLFKTIYVDTTAAAGNYFITLPTSVHAGAYIDIVKASADSNIVLVIPPSGTISGFDRIRIGRIFAFCRFIYTGVVWLRVRAAGEPGPEQLIPSISLNLPVGAAWLDGSQFDRVNCPELFNAIGTLYGVGNGVTTANLPDVRGRFLLANDQGVGRIIEANTPGVAGGLRGVTLGQAQLPNCTFVVDSGIAVTVSDTRAFQASVAQSSANPGVSSSATVVAGGGNTGAHSFDVSAISGSISGQTSATGVAHSGGSGASAPILPPFLTINYYVWLQ